MASTWTDTLSLNRFPYESNVTYMPWQDSGSYFWRKNVEHYGMCNAIMIAPPNSTFVDNLIDSYKSFRSYGHDEYWDEHSVRLPAQIYESCSYKDEVVPIDSKRSLWPLWSEIKKLYERKSHMMTMHDLRTRWFPRTYFFHMWSSQYNAGHDGCDTSHPSIFMTIACEVYQHVLLR